MTQPTRAILCTALVGPILWLTGASAVSAQETAESTKAGAILVVDGAVREVFKNVRQSQTDYLVEIDIRASSAQRISAQTRGIRFPAPGETVYVHVVERPAEAASPARIKGSAAAAALPAEGAQVRAYLKPRAHWGWEGAAADWFELTSDQPATPLPVDEQDGSRDLGMSTEPAQAGGRLALRVTSVERGGPARDAGLEIGDLIVGAQGARLTSAEQIEELARRADVIPLVVVDVNTGRTAQVELRMDRAPDSESPTADKKPTVDSKITPPPANNPQAPRKSLGISAEPIVLGQRTALKVTRVEPNSPAAKAGLEPGDVLVKANDAALTGPEQLAAALRKSGPKMTVTVRDVRTGREVPVDIDVGGPASAPPPTGDATPPAANTAKGRLGAVTELTFYDAEAAVRVTEIEPRSPAARAGLQAGTLVLEADGKPVLHPNDLLDAERNSSGTLKLTVVDARSGKKSAVEVDLRGGR